MKTKSNLLKMICAATFVCLFSVTLSAQNNNSDFWQNIRFGGGIGLNFGNGFFSGTIAPSAIYEFSDYFAMGPSLIYSYQSGQNFNTSLYGGSLIALANPFDALQLSAELEQLRVNQTIEFTDGNIDDDFWNTALFVGAGFRTGPAVLGVRYNILFEDGQSVYADAWSPFVRVYF